MSDPSKRQSIFMDDDRHENESDGLVVGWYNDDFPDDPGHDPAPPENIRWELEYQDPDVL